MKFFGFLSLSLLLSSSLVAQSGWDHIHGNDNRNARAAFEAAFEADSTDHQALKGLIYLSDIEDDYISKRKYIGTLLRHHWSEPYHQLFSYYSEFTGEELLKKPGISIAMQCEARYGNAWEVKRKRDFARYEEEMAALFNDIRWSYIGPFGNTNGYAYVQSHEVETDPYDAKNTYINPDKLEVSWFVPKYVNTDHEIDFTTHLAGDYSGALYYANAFIEVAQGGSYQLRVSRDYPIVIWIDDNIVFSDREYIEFGWDREIVDLDLEAGTHRVLVKYVMGHHYTGVRRGGDSYFDGYGRGLRVGNRSSFDYGFDWSWFDEGYDWGSGLHIRFTDANGQTANGITGRPEARPYTKRSYATKVTDNVTVKHFLSEIELNPDDWFNYFLLYSACLDYGNLDRYEEYFVNVYKDHPESTFFKALVADVYDHNGKNERADQSLKDIDLEKTPVFSVMFKNLSQIDAEAEEEKYMDHIEKMLAITPTNYRLITEKLDHLKSTGKSEECKAYAKQVMDDYAYYEGEFDDYLEDDNKPWDYSIGSDDKADFKERQKDLKEAKKNIRKEYYAFYYTRLIDHYKGKGTADKVLPLYDELIGIEKHRADYRTNKAEYLFNLERYEEALQALDVVLQINPYDADTYELIGDIHKDKQDKDKALEYYEKARELGSSGSSEYDFFGFGGDNGVDEKIVEITGPRKLKNKFKTPSFEEMMVDSVDDLYKGEQSVILGYTRDIAYDEFGYANLYSKLLVKIMSDAGAKEWIEHDFYYLGQIDNLKLIKKDGAEIYPDRRGTSVVFKNLQPGDIIQVEGSLDWRPSAPFGSELITFNLMNFQHPTHYSKFEVGLPKGKYLGYRLHNLADKLEKEEREDMDFYRWEYRKLPKVIEEEAQLDRTDPYAVILVSTVEDWSPIVDWYKSQSYRKLEADYEILNILDTIIADGMTEEDKVIAVYNFITKDINYSYNTMLQTGYIPKKTGLTCSSRIGDCKDVATLMITMLRELDIEAFYVLVKSNQYFHLKTLPSTFFDHVITGYKLGDGQVRYLELTTDFYPWYVLNENDIQAWALKIVDGEKAIFQLPNDLIDEDKSPVRYDIKADIGQDQALTLNVKANYSGMAGGYMREIIDMTSNDNMNNRLLEALNNKNFKNLELDTYGFENERELTEPFRASYELSAQNYGEAVADLTLINIPFIKVIEPNTIFGNKERFSAINMSEIVSVYPTTQVVDMTFPAGYRLKEVPQNIAVDNPYVSYNVVFEKTATGIRVTKKQVFKKMYVSIEEFQDFRKHYLALVGYDAMKLVVVR